MYIIVNIINVVNVNIVINKILECSLSVKFDVCVHLWTPVLPRTPDADEMKILKVHLKSIKDKLIVPAHKKSKKTITVIKVLTADLDMQEFFYQVIILYAYIYIRTYTRIYTGIYTCIYTRIYIHVYIRILYIYI